MKLGGFWNNFTFIHITNLNWTIVNQSKGYMIIDEFNCAGFNTNSFLKRFGGMNKGRPDEEDLKHAERFAQNLKQKLE